MRLLAGYFPVWNADAQKFFSQSPREFALFYYLLGNAHYGENPFWTLIKGKTQKGEAYKKDWCIQEGDISTSKVQIKAFWGFDCRTQKKLLDNLAEKGLIEILLEDPALIIRIKNHAYFSWAGKVTERPNYVHTHSVELHTPSVELHTPSVELHTPSVILSKADTSPTFSEGQNKLDPPQNYIQCKNHNQTENKNKGEDARARVEAEESPPLKIKEEESGSQDGKSDPIETNKKIPPIEANELVLRWLVRCRRLRKLTPFNDFEILREVVKLAEFYSYKELGQILAYLENSATKVAQELISPMDATKKYFGTHTLIEQAFIELKKDPVEKVREQQRLLDEKEAEKKRLKFEEEKLREREEKKERPKGFLTSIVCGKLV